MQDWKLFINDINDFCNYLTWQTLKLCNEQKLIPLLHIQISIRNYRILEIVHNFVKTNCI